MAAYPVWFRNIPLRRGDVFLGDAVERVPFGPEECWVSRGHQRETACSGKTLSRFLQLQDWQSV